MTRHDPNRPLLILEYIEGCRERGLPPPTVREIAEAVGLASTAAVYHHLLNLREQGLVKLGRYGLTRSVSLTPEGRDALGLSQPCPNCGGTGKVA